MRIIIAGAGEVGSHLAKMLNSGSNQITVIESDTTRLRTLTESIDVVGIEGKSTSLEVLRRAGAERADLFIAVNPDHSQDVNIVSAILAKQLGSKKVIARINNEEYLSYDNKLLFTEMGIDFLFYPEKIAANEIVEHLERTAYNDSLTFGRGKLQMAVFKLEEDSPLIDSNVFDFSKRFEKAQEEGNTMDLQFRVVAISRKDTTIIPGPQSKFRYGDRVYIVAKREGIDMIMKDLGRRNENISKLMILGGGPIGAMVAKQLSSKMESIKLIEINRDKCIELSEKLGSKVTVVNGDGRNTDFLMEESIADYDAFVAVTNNSEANILACVAAKKLGIDHTIAEVENLEYISLAEEMGVDFVINKKEITAGRIYKFTLSNKVRFIKFMSGTNAKIIEYNVAPEAKVTKVPLKGLKDKGFPREAVIGGLIRGSETIIAVGDTQIQGYDSVVVFADPKVVKDVDKFFN